MPSFVISCCCGCCENPPANVDLAITAPGCMYDGATAGMASRSPTFDELAAGITQIWEMNTPPDVIKDFNSATLRCENGAYIVQITVCSVNNTPNIIDIPVTGSCSPFTLSGTLNNVVTSCCPDGSDLTADVVAA